MIINITENKTDFNDGTYAIGGKFLTDNSISYKGEGPTKGQVVVSEGAITSAELCVQGYAISYAGSKATYSDTNDYCDADKTFSDNLGSVSNKAYSVGDQVTVAGQQWYVIKTSTSSDATVTLLKSTNTDSSTYSFDSTSPYTNVYADSTIKGLVDTYVASLNLGNNLIEGRLITLEELETLGCSSSGYTCTSAPVWVYSTNYWTGSPYADSSSRAWNVSSNGYFNDYRVDDDYSFGLRPVITVSKSVIS